MRRNNNYYSNQLFLDLDSCFGTVEDIMEPEENPACHKRGRKPKCKRDDDVVVSKKVYKTPINKALLKEMLLDVNSESENVSDYVKELNKTVDVIFNKHFSKYYTMKEDLEADAVLAVYNKRQYYDASKDAYNFIYAIMRNEMTNKLSKLSRITLIDSYVSYNEMTKNRTNDTGDMPERILKWSDYLLGDIDYNYIKIPKKDALEIIVWLKIHERGQQSHCIPSFLEVNENNMNALYKLLKLIII